jgi:RsiW-degrading membrane proteinase PrsW (M82 family)
MSGVWILLLLIFMSALPVFLVFLWFHLSRFPLSRRRCLCALLAGAAALFPDLLLQRIVPAMSAAFSGRWGLLIFGFIRIAFTEELSRLLVLSAFFFISGDLKKAYPHESETGKAGVNAGARGAALGLLAGLGFAMVESAAYGAADFRILLPRAFTAAPLHGACGARIGSVPLLVRDSPLRAIFRFFSAVIIHGIYNFMITKSGLSTLLAVLIALSALASSALEIHHGMKGI